MGVTEDQAIKEFERFIESKNISKKKRESFQEQEEEIIDAISRGVVTVDEEGVISMDLFSPLESISKIQFKTRLLVREARNAFKVVDEKDSLGRMIAILTKITDQKNSKVWGEFDFTDLNLAGQISNYFL